MKLATERAQKALQEETDRLEKIQKELKEKEDKEWIEDQKSLIMEEILEEIKEATENGDNITSYIVSRNQLEILPLHKRLAEEIKSDLEKEDFQVSIHITDLNSGLVGLKPSYRIHLEISW